MQSKVDMILETLPTSYNQFKLNYNMNKLDMDLTELMQELQDAQSIMKSKNYVHFVQASSSGSNLKGNKSKRKQIKGKGKRKVDQTLQSTGVKPKGKCFKCRQKGHWKNDRPKFMANNQKREEATK